MVSSSHTALARTLILDEIFDLTLYRALRDMSDGGLRELLDELIQVEQTHVAFWQNFFQTPLQALDIGRRLKLWTLLAACRLFGPAAIHLILEAIEIYGVRKYLAIWKSYKEQPLGHAVRGILVDEFKHEDAIVSRMTERKLNPEGIRNIFLGLNDGLVEILGAVSGFFAAFGDAITVLIAGTTTAVAGSLSMAAGAYVALSSEGEVKSTEDDKRRFLSEAALPGHVDTISPHSALDVQPFSSALVVGGSYFLGAAIPLLPILLGAHHPVFSVITAGTVISFVSMILAFLSGMNVRRRIVTNLFIMGGAVAVTYVIGLLVRTVWGIAV